jgi:hypothetical protein
MTPAAGRRFAQAPILASAAAAYNERIITYILFYEITQRNILIFRYLMCV